MTRLLLGAVCAAAFTIHVAPSEASCIPTFNWHGYTYLPAGPLDDDVKSGAAIPLPAQVPSCDDTPGPEGPTPITYTDKAVTRIAGIEPSIAVSDGGAVYVSQSTFPALKSHPLHKQIRHYKAPPVTGEPCTVEGLAKTGTSGLVVNGARIVVTAKTKVGPQRHGTGFVPPGMKIRVEGSACGNSYPATSGQYVKAAKITRVKP